MRSLDWLKRIEFINLHDAAAWQDRYPKLAPERLMAEIHVIDKAGTVFAGFAGSRRMLREVPLGLPLWLALQLPGMERIGQRVYRFIARRRYRINAWLGNALADCVDGGCKMLS
jgi:predicted DCC family thiol-disulfide oxidoreductase YuxK